MIKNITILFIIFILLIFGAVGLKLFKKNNVITTQYVELTEDSEPEKEKQKEIEVPETTPTETQQIEDWIKQNNLNRYGDPIDFVYAGGTPLFNEQTGQTIDRYEYILENHPDKPWLQ